MLPKEELTDNTNKLYTYNYDVVSGAPHKYEGPSVDWDGTNRVIYRGGTGNKPLIIAESDQNGDVHYYSGFGLYYDPYYGYHNMINEENNEEIDPIDYFDKNRFNTLFRDKNITTLFGSDDKIDNNRDRFNLRWKEISRNEAYNLLKSSGFYRSDNDIPIYFNFNKQDDKNFKLYYDNNVLMRNVKYFDDNTSRGFLTGSRNITYTLPLYLYTDRDNGQFNGQFTFRPAESEGLAYNMWYNDYTGKYYITDKQTNEIVASSNHKNGNLGFQYGWEPYFTGLHDSRDYPYLLLLYFDKSIYTSADDLAAILIGKELNAPADKVMRYEGNYNEESSDLHERLVPITDENGNIIYGKDGKPIGYKTILVGRLNPELFKTDVYNASWGGLNSTLRLLTYPFLLIDHTIAGGAKVLFDPNYSTGDLGEGYWNLLNGNFLNWNLSNKDNKIVQNWNDLTDDDSLLGNIITPTTMYGLLKTVKGMMNPRPTNVSKTNIDTSKVHYSREGDITSPTIDGAGSLENTVGMPSGHPSEYVVTENSALYPPSNTAVAEIINEEGYMPLSTIRVSSETPQSSVVTTLNNGSNWVTVNGNSSNPSIYLIPTSKTTSSTGGLWIPVTNTGVSNPTNTNSTTYTYNPLTGEYSINDDSNTFSYNTTLNYSNNLNNTQVSNNNINEEQIGGLFDNYNNLTPSLFNFLKNNYQNLTPFLRAGLFHPFLFLKVLNSDWFKNDVTNNPEETKRAREEGVYPITTLEEELYKENLLKAVQKGINFSMLNGFKLPEVLKRIGFYTSSTPIHAENGIVYDEDGNVIGYTLGDVKLSVDMNKASKDNNLYTYTDADGVKHVIQYDKGTYNPEIGEEQNWYYYGYPSPQIQLYDNKEESKNKFNKTNVATTNTATHKVNVPLHSYWHMHPDIETHLPFQTFYGWETTGAHEGEHQVQDKYYHPYTTDNQNTGYSVIDPDASTYPFDEEGNNLRQEVVDTWPWSEPGDGYNYWFESPDEFNSDYMATRKLFNITKDWNEMSEDEKRDLFEKMQKINWLWGKFHSNKMDDDEIKEWDDEHDVGNKVIDWDYWRWRMHVDACVKAGYLRKHGGKLNKYYSNL